MGRRTSPVLTQVYCPAGAWPAATLQRRGRRGSREASGAAERDERTAVGVCADAHVIAQGRPHLGAGQPQPQPRACSDARGLAHPPPAAGGGAVPVVQLRGVPGAGLAGAAVVPGAGLPGARLRGAAGAGRPFCLGRRPAHPAPPVTGLLFDKGANHTNGPHVSIVSYLPSRHSRSRDDSAGPPGAATAGSPLRWNRRGPRRDCRHGPVCRCRRADAGCCSVGPWRLPVRRRSQGGEGEGAQSLPAISRDSPGRVTWSRTCQCTDPRSHRSACSLFVSHGKIEFKLSYESCLEPRGAVRAELSFASRGERRRAFSPCGQSLSLYDREHVQRAL